MKKKNGEDLKKNIEVIQEKTENRLKDVKLIDESKKELALLSDNETVPMEVFTSDKLNVFKGLNLIKPEDLEYLQDHADEFQERFIKRSFFRSKFEMMYGVLSKSEHPTVDSQYWQAIGEQSVHVQEVTSLHYAYKKLLADIEYKKVQIDELQYSLDEKLYESDFERRKIQARLKKKQVELQEQQFSLVLQRKSAKERMKEIRNWTEIIADLKPQVKHGLDDWEAHHPERYIMRYGQRLQNLNLLGDNEKEHVIKHFSSYANAPENKELAEKYIQSYKGGYISNNESNKILMNEQQKVLNNEKAVQPPSESNQTDNDPIKKLQENNNKIIRELPQPSNSNQIDYESEKDMMEKDPVTKAFFNRKIKTILVATPHRRKDDPNVTNFFKLQTPAAFNVTIKEPYGFTVADARNLIVDHAIKGGFDYIFFVDDDVLIPRNALVKLVSHKADIVGGFYYRKYYPLESVGIHVDENDEPVPIEILTNKMIQEGVKGYKIGDIIHNTLILPSGITLIKTEVFKNMEPPWYRTCTIHGRPAITEDTYLCQKARNLGFDIITDLGIQGLHIDKERNIFYGHPDIVDSNQNMVYANWREYFAI